MTQLEFKAQWKRLTTLLEVTNKQEENMEMILAEFWKEYGLSSSEFWEKCVDRIIHEPGRRFFPSPGEMAAVAQQIREKTSKVGCDECQGTGFLMVEINGRSGVKPCVCHQGMIYEDKRRPRTGGGLKSIREMIG